MFSVDWKSLTAVAWVLNLVIVIVGAGVFLMLEKPTIRRSEMWRACVTPLASIIGSGFLVVAPLMGFLVGPWAPLAIATICLLAYGVGSSLRWNIRHLEDFLEGAAPLAPLERALLWVARFSKAILVGAYLIAVTFYLELLGAFLLRFLEVEGVIPQKMLASIFLSFIGLFGLWRGLHALEFLEEHAVNTKLAIIAALLVGLVFYNGKLWMAGLWELPQLKRTVDVMTLRKLLGALLIVQGFETSRYLRGEYSQTMRVATMRYAQWISSGIYISFVLLASVLVGNLSMVSETGIIDLSSRVAFSLPFLLVGGAVLSQFSAAIADTLGAGGLVEEAFYGKISHRKVYGAVWILGLCLVWTTEIFQVIAYASQAFALYYMLQCLMSAIYSVVGPASLRNYARGGFFLLLAGVMLGVALFGVSAESGPQ